ncbi:MAG: phage head-tail connector protein [Oceanicaulis sp.]
MTLHLITPPAAEPVALDDAKTWLRVAHAEEDDLITELIRSAAARVEAETGLALIARSYREVLDAWSARRLSAYGQAVRVARGPLISVEAVRTYARDGTPEIWDTAEYRAETGEPGRIIAVYPFSLPQPGRAAGGIEIEFTSGFGAAADAVPAALKEAVLRLVAQSYATAEPAESARRGEAGLAEDVAALLRPWRRVRL